MGITDLGMISVIVPVYEVKDYLPACIESILSQTYPYLDIILIDDGSKDGCSDVCDEYAGRDNRIRVLHTSNSGLSSARNRGIEMAIESNSRYLGFVDGDDWIEATMYQRLIEAANRYDADICCCGWLKESKNSTSEKCYSENVYTNTEAMAELCYERITSVLWNKLYRKKLFEDIRFPEELNFEDIAMMHEIIHQSKKVATISNMGYHYRKRANSITGTHSAKNTIDLFSTCLIRYHYYKNEAGDLAEDLEIALLKKCAGAISKTWRWYYCWSREDRLRYHPEVDRIRNFTREHYPLFGFRKHPFSLRLSVFFAHSNSFISLGIMYLINQIYQAVCKR